jgi:transketolase
MFITADMGAPAMDRFKRDLSGQFRDVGIAEQAAASIAAGMAHSGKIPFIYAIAPFLVSRIAEHHKVNAGIQSIPYHTLGVGAGFSYADSGPTHYNTEDLAIMRAVPNMVIFSPSDSIMAAELTQEACQGTSPTYLRLERSLVPILSKKGESFEAGFRHLFEGDRTCIVATGIMVHEALKARELLHNEGTDIGVVDVFRIKPLNVEGLVNALQQYRHIVSVEEHLLSGGLGSTLSEMITDNNLPQKLRRLGVNDKHVYLYGRENIQRNLGIDSGSIARAVLDSQKRS